jgi:hypothetical protein
LSYGSDAAIRCCWRGDPRHLKQILNAAAADAQRHERKDRQGAALCRVQNQERRVAKKNRMRGDTPGGGRGRIACCKRASVCEGLVGCKHLVPSVLCSCGPGGWADEGWGCVRSALRRACAFRLLRADPVLVSCLKPLATKTPAKPGARSREELRAPEAARGQSQRPLTP